MKLIKIKDGAKTTYRYVDDNYVEEQKEIPQKDLTGGASLIAYTDISQEKWDRIFNKKEEK